MAGTVNISLQQQFDSQGLPLGGGKLYCFQSGTSTPQSAYKDIALTLVHQNPVELDASGRVPQMFFADGTIKLRLTDRTGTTVVFEADFLPVLGASSGGAVGGSVDATTVFATGDLKHRYQDGVISGWVQANGQTIGPASSGASSRANADCQALFQYLWANDTSLTVAPGGRGASALADWNAGTKTITLPDMRGRTLAGMDTMGSTNATRIHTILASNVMGSVGGNQLFTIAVGNLPSHTHSLGSVNSVSALSAGAHAHDSSNLTATLGGGHTPSVLSSSLSTTVLISGNNIITPNAGSPGGTTIHDGSGGSGVFYPTSVFSSPIITTTLTSLTMNAVADHTHPVTGQTTSNGAHTHVVTGTSDATGTGTQMSITPPVMVVTIYIKL